MGEVAGTNLLKSGLRMFVLCLRFGCLLFGCHELGLLVVHLLLCPCSLYLCLGKLVVGIAKLEVELLLVPSSSSTTTGGGAAAGRRLAKRSSMSTLKIELSLCASSRTASASCCASLASGSGFSSLAMLCCTFPGGFCPHSRSHHLHLGAQRLRHAHAPHCKQ